VAPSRPVAGTYLRAIERIPRALGSLVWSLAGLIVALSIGRLCLLSWSDPRGQPAVSRIQEIQIDTTHKAQLDRAVTEALKKAKADALAHGGELLAAWSDKVMARVDPGFLDWYFGYLRQQILGLQGLWYGAWHWIDSGQATAQARLSEYLQGQFAAHALRPEIAQHELNRITQDVVNRYVSSVRDNVSEIPGRVQVSEAEWRRYLADAGSICSRVEADRSVPISLKMLVTSTVAGTVILAQPIKELAVRVVGIVAPKFAARIAYTAGAETGAKVLGSAAGKLVGTVLTIGFIAWDVHDHRATVAQQRPLLKQSISDYLTAIREDLLKGPNGIASVIDNLEREIVPASRTTPTTTTARP